MAAKGLLGSGNVPTILGAKPSPAEPRGSTEQRGPILKIMKDESALKGRSGPIGSLKIVDDKWQHTGEKVNQFLSESNVDYQVVGVLGPPAVGKSTILNAFYGLPADHPSIAAGRTAPPFPVQTDETRMLARHSSSGVELRVTAERLILLDSQPLFSPSVLTDITRPDGSASVSPLPGAPTTAEHALEAMALQQAVFLFSVCHVILVVSDGLEDRRLWELLQAAQLLRERVFRPPSAPLSTPHQPGSVPRQSPRSPEDERPTSGSGSLTGSQVSQWGEPVSQPGTRPSQGESRPGSAASSRGDPPRPGSGATAHSFDVRKSPQATPQRPGLHSPEVIFVATKLKGSQLLGGRLQAAQEKLSSAFPAWAMEQSRTVGSDPLAIRDRTSGWRFGGASDDMREKRKGSEQDGSWQSERLPENESTGESSALGESRNSPTVRFYALPAKGPNSAAFESFGLSLRTFRDRILGIPRKHLLGKPITEASWLRYTSKVWRDIQESEDIKKYCSMLQHTGFFR